MLPPFDQIPLNDTIISYFRTFGARQDPLLAKHLADTMHMPCSHMQRSPITQLVCFFMQLLRAKDVLELGTFLGHTTLGMALSMGDSGNVVTCDIRKQDVAMSYAKAYGLINRITFIQNKAMTVLDQLIHIHRKFDCIFIDADKRNYLAYYEKSLTCLADRGVIIIDNTLWKGEVANKATHDKRALAVHELNTFIASDSRVHFMLLPLSDGVTIVTKKIQ